MVGVGRPNISDHFIVYSRENKLENRKKLMKENLEGFCSTWELTTWI